MSNIMLEATLIIPALMIIMGIICKGGKPAKINNMVGYRTKRSMINQDTWDYAQKLMGKLWLIIGLVAAVLAVIIMLTLGRGESAMVVGIVMIVVELVAMFASIYVIESDLKKTFDEKGNRR